MKAGDLARRHDLVSRTFSLEAMICSVGILFQTVSNRQEPFQIIPYKRMNPS